MHFVCPGGPAFRGRFAGKQTFLRRHLHFAPGCGKIIGQSPIAPNQTERYALVAQSVEHLTFNQRAWDSSSHERTKIPRRIARFFVGFFCFKLPAHFCTFSAHRRERRASSAQAAGGAFGAFAPSGQKGIMQTGAIWRTRSRRPATVRLPPPAGAVPCCGRWF